MAPTAWCWLITACWIWGSSFTWVNAGTSGRGTLLPTGLFSEPSVRNANLIAVRTSILAEVGIVCDQVVLVEQPNHHTSNLLSLPRWQSLMGRRTLVKSVCQQGCYMAETPKPTMLISNHARFNLSNKLTADDVARIAAINKELVTKKRDSQGRLRITGIPEKLKSTQCYTREFGQAIVTAWSGACVPWLHSHCSTCWADMSDPIAVCR